MVLDNQDVQRRRRGLGRVGRGRPSAAAGGQAAAPRTRCPCRGLRYALQRGRRAVAPAGAPASSRCRGRRGTGASERSICVNRSKTRSSMSSSMPTPLSFTASTTSSPSRPAVRLIAAALVGVLARVVQEVDEHLDDAGRVAFQAQRLVRQRHRQLVLLGLESGAVVWTASAAAAAKSNVDRRSSSLPWAMRVRSSRSSTRRTICLTWRSTMSRAC